MSRRIFALNCEIALKKQAHSHSPLLAVGLASNESFFTAEPCPGVTAACYRVFTCGIISLNLCIFYLLPKH
jgi:hypothetical protein